ncbi:hypothetical protein [Phocaeicola coprocola]|jgi:hypothetical protein|uniref:hypothetical protein n=1 Tax=Phocaeicola coprocola TaxID=310298 RepID=UPI0011C0CAE0|nr:hypothetical protein [Phocaeicola coprocola]
MKKNHLLTLITSIILVAFFALIGFYKGELLELFRNLNRDKSKSEVTINEAINNSEEIDNKDLRAEFFLSSIEMAPVDRSGVPTLLPYYGYNNTILDYFGHYLTSSKYSLAKFGELGTYYVDAINISSDSIQILKYELGMNIENELLPYLYLTAGYLEIRINFINYLEQDNTFQAKDRFNVMYYLCTGKKLEGSEKWYKYVDELYESQCEDLWKTGNFSFAQETKNYWDLFVWFGDIENNDMSTKRCYRFMKEQDNHISLRVIPAGEHDYF